jgi:hypothetical protein
LSTRLGAGDVRTAIRHPDLGRLVQAVVDADEHDEADWIEWKSTLTTKIDHRSRPTTRAKAVSNARSVGSKRGRTTWRCSTASWWRIRVSVSSVGPLGSTFT